MNYAGIENLINTNKYIPNGYYVKPNDGRFMEDVSI